MFETYCSNGNIHHCYDNRKKPDWLFDYSPTGSNIKNDEYINSIFQWRKQRSFEKYNLYCLYFYGFKNTSQYAACATVFIRVIWGRFWIWKELWCGWDIIIVSRCIVQWGLVSLQELVCIYKTFFVILCLLERCLFNCWFIITFLSFLLCDFFCIFSTYREVDKWIIQFKETLPC